MWFSHLGVIFCHFFEFLTIFNIFSIFDILCHFSHLGVIFTPRCDLLSFFRIFNHFLAFLALGRYYSHFEAKLKFFGHYILVEMYYKMFVPIGFQVWPIFRHFKAFFGHFRGNFVFFGSIFAHILVLRGFLLSTNQPYVFKSSMDF